MKAEPTPIFDSLLRAYLVRLRPIQLRNPSINLTKSLAQVIKAFQNPIWAEQARERLKQINILTKAAIV